MTTESLIAATVLCTGCGKPLSGGGFNSGEEFRCGSCGVKLGVEVFPALFHGAEKGAAGEALTDVGDAGCFYHPLKKAAAVCAACGRFLCSLCETDLAGRCLCPSCIHTGRQNEQLETLVTQRVLHDSMALSVAILPMLFFPVTVISAPIAIYLAIRNWKNPGTILPRTKLRFVAAIIIALLQIAGWVAVLVGLAL